MSVLLNKKTTPQVPFIVYVIAEDQRLKHDASKYRHSRFIAINRINNSFRSKQVDAVDGLN